MNPDIIKKSDYAQATEICRQALHTFRMDVNDYLPDYRTADMWRDMYRYPWDVDSIQEVYDLFIHAAHSVLSTVMANHISYEIHCCDQKFREAVENKSIIEGQAALKDAMRVFGDLLYVLKVLEKSFDTIAREVDFN